MKKYIIAAGLALLATNAHAQHSPNCVPKIVPEPSVTQTAATGITGHIFFTAPPTAAELSGHITYPFAEYKYPFGATSVGMMYLMAQTYKVPGWLANRIGYFWIPANNTEYVVGRSGNLYPYVKDGIRFIWYEILPGTTVTSGEPIDKFRITIDEGDSVGINTSLSTPLHYGESVILGVNMIYPYPEPIRVHLAFHSRECYF